MAQTRIALGVGHEMPAFELPDEEGRPFNLPERLEEILWRSGPRHASFLSHTHALQFIWLAAPWQHLRETSKKEGIEPSSGELSAGKMLHLAP